VSEACAFEVPGSGTVSALLDQRAKPALGYVLAHGAGAGMRHPFLEAVAVRLAGRGVATFRYQFPYMEARKRRPDAPAVAVATVRAAVEEAARRLAGLPLIAGGKSFGGRMTSTAAAEAPLPAVRGLAFLGFPLHPPGKPGIARAEHLDRVTVPMLFLQGTRDEFAELRLLKQVLQRLGRRAAFHCVEGGDHSFRVPKSAVRSADVLDELAETLSSWAAAL
jgi:predicted alpha/beta-hydrolase family hydrolase